MGWKEVVERGGEEGAGEVLLAASGCLWLPVYYSFWLTEGSAQEEDVCEGVMWAWVF